MLFTVILVEVLLVAGIAVAVLRDEKKQIAAYHEWAGTKTNQFTYRFPLYVVIHDEMKAASEDVRVVTREVKTVAKEVKREARHKYVHP